MIHKVLSVKQPWSFLICSGIKDIENRTWKCPQKYIGKRVLIHASGTAITFGQFCDYIENLDNEDLGLQKILRDNCFSKSWLHTLETSAIIGSVEIVDCVINHPSIWAEKSATNCSEDCRKTNCEYFIEWGFMSDRDCRSCKLIGQSYEIEAIPKECPHSMKIHKIYNWVVSEAILFDNPILNVMGKLGFWDYDLPEEYEKNSHL